MSLTCKLFRHDWDVLVPNDVWPERGSEGPTIGSVCYRCNMVYTLKGPMNPNDPIADLTKFAQAMHGISIPPAAKAKSLIGANHQYGETAVSYEDLVKIAAYAGLTESDTMLAKNQLKVEQDKMAAPHPDSVVPPTDKPTTVAFNSVGDLKNVKIEFEYARMPFETMPTGEQIVRHLLAQLVHAVADTYQKADAQWQTKMTA